MDKRSSDTAAVSVVAPANGSTNGGARLVVLGYMVLLAFGFFGFVRIEQSLNHVEELREQRVVDTARADLLSCARGNAQDERDKSQDRLLLSLIVAALAEEPNGFDREAPRAVERLRARIDQPPPRIADRAPVPKYLLPFVRAPFDCRELPSQRPFEP